MSLRTKILAYVVVLMSIVFVMVLATIVPDTLLFQKLRADAAREALGALSRTLEQLTAAQRREMIQRHPALLREQGLLEGWIIVTDDNRVEAWLLPGERPERLTEDLARRLELDLVNTFISKDGETLIVYGRSRASGGVTVDLWQTLVVMMVGTAFLVLVLYLLLLRMVVRPLERLAEASQSSAASKGLVKPVPHTERDDEIGELVRAYNAMALEVNDLRLNLERRVAQATQELQAAQGQIVVSERLSVAGRMAAGVAHEINNPLGGMLNAARTLRGKAADGSREAEYLDLILEGLSRLQQIVATMLQFSRPALQVTEVNLKEVMTGAAMFCQHRIDKLGIKVEWQSALGPDETPRAYGRRSELGQVFLNLLVNALDAMEARGTGVEHRLTLGLRKNEKFLLASVTDTGAGMSAEVRAKAGQFFFTTKGESKGTGLGLAVVQHIVVQGRGKMQIDSTEGQGTMVTLELPLEPPPAPVVERTGETKMLVPDISRELLG